MLVLQVRTSNQGVIEFYRRIGFAIDDVLSMGKRLEHDGPADHKSMEGDGTTPAG